MAGRAGRVQGAGRDPRGTGLLLGPPPPLWGQRGRGLHAGDVEGLHEGLIKVVALQ